MRPGVTSRDIVGIIAMRQDAKLLSLQQVPHPEAVFQFSETPARTDNERSVSELLDIHEYERKRMGQELHDSAGQLLVSLQLNVARLRYIERSYERESLMDEIQETVRL